MTTKRIVGLLRRLDEARNVALINYQNKRSKDGLQYYCKECAKELTKKNYKKKTSIPMIPEKIEPTIDFDETIDSQLISIENKDASWSLAAEILQNVLANLIRTYWNQLEIWRRKIPPRDLCLLNQAILTEERNI